MTNSGYFRIPRSLMEHAAVQGAPFVQRWVLIEIISRMSYENCTLDDHGVLIDLEPGQILTTYRKLAEQIEVSKNDIERCVRRFLKSEILRQEVRHTKTILTIAHKETRELFLRIRNIAVRHEVRQERDKIETQTKNTRNKEHKENNNSNVPERIEISKGNITYISGPFSKCSAAAGFFKCLEALGLKESEIDLIKKTVIEIDSTYENLLNAIQYAKNAREKNQLNKSFGAALNWAVRESPTVILPVDPEQNRRIAEKYFETWRAEYYILEVYHKTAELTPKSGTASPIVLALDSNNFEENLKKNLHDKKFEPINQKQKVTA